MQLKKTFLLHFILALIVYAPHTRTAAPQSAIKLHENKSHAAQWTEDHSEVWFRSQQAIVFPEDLAYFERAMNLARAHKETLNWKELEPVCKKTIAQWTEQTDSAYKHAFSTQHPEKWKSLLEILNYDNSTPENETYSFLRETFKTEKK